MAKDAKERMTIVNGRHPPNIDKIDRKFHVKDKANILYCYGTSIYNPDSLVIPNHIFVHEVVHSFRQEWSSVEEWWDKYISNPRFRLAEEIVAHRSEWGQYVFDNKDKNDQSKYLHFMAVRLSGELYEGLCSYKEARAHITHTGIK